MPGYIIHLAAAKLALSKLGFVDFKESQGVYIGSIVADAMPRSAKQKSHFWDDDMLKLLKRVPNVDRFTEKYRSMLNTPTVAAYYAHLLMDRRFVYEYWNEHFYFFNKNMEPEESFEGVAKVRIKNRDGVIDREVFLSDEYYYGDYTRLLAYIVQKYKLNGLFIDEENNISYTPEVYRSYLNEIVSGKNGFAVDEINLISSSQLCMNMISTVYKTAYEDNINIEGISLKPQLNVFEIDEIEKLIEETSEFLKNLLIHYKKD